MLHDQMMFKVADDLHTDTTVDDRRSSDRVPFPAEVILAWNHHPDTTLRYRVLDAGDGGYRIHSSMPMLEGTTGMVIRLLPSRRSAPLGQPVMIAWCKESTDDHGGYDIGLRCF